MSVQAEPAEVWQVLQNAGANENAIEWARPYGRDLRRMWEECAHGELMLGLAAKQFVPPLLLGWTVVEIIRSSMPQDLRRIDTGILEALVGIEDWMLSDDEGEMEREEAILMPAISAAERRNDEVCAAAGNAVMCLLIGLNHCSHHDCKTYPLSMATAVIHCSTLRGAVCHEAGETNPRTLHHVQQVALEEFAATARRFIPFTVLVTGALGLVMRPTFGDC